MPKHKSLYKHVYNSIAHRSSRSWRSSYTIPSCTNSSYRSLNDPAPQPPDYVISKCKQSLAAYRRFTFYMERFMYEVLITMFKMSSFARQYFPRCVWDPWDCMACQCTSSFRIMSWVIENNEPNAIFSSKSLFSFYWDYSAQDCISIRCFHPTPECGARS